ncbi:MAG: hypothetical protein C4318_07925 [Acidimicrobiia bacterium]
MVNRPALKILVIGTAAIVLASGCNRGSKGVANSGATGLGGKPGGDEVAMMFLRNKDKLKPAAEPIETSLSLDLAGFVVPLAGSGSNEVSLDFSARNADGAPPLVVAALIPYEVGDLEKGNGARFIPLENQSFVLGPGEKKQVSVRCLRERLTPGTPTPPSGTFPGGQPASPGAQPGVQEKTLQYKGMAAANGPDIRLTQESSPSPLFDPAFGLKVLMVLAEQGSVDPGIISALRKVDDDDFERAFGKFQRREFAIPVPPEQIL